jgi:hypothetical protein
MKDIHFKSEELLSQLRSIEELKVVTVDEFKIIFSPETGETGLILTANDTDYVLPINNLESVVTSYYINGFAKHAHVPDIYAAYMHLTKSFGFELKHAIVESKCGDISYGRLIWKDGESKLFTQVVTPGDVFVFAHMFGIKPGIVESLLEDMSTPEDWSSSYDIEDW